MKSRNLHKAKAAKNDEFYTQRRDVENELRHYVSHFAGKVVYCNCDDPKASEFYKFFFEKFKAWELKGLIASCYQNADPDLFSRHDADKAVAIEYDGERERVIDLRGDGDFRKAESIEMLKKADIVCTNPPFSLFRDYVCQLMEYDKKFIVIGPWNAVKYKDIFPHIKANRLWLGHGFSAGNAYFAVPSARRDEYAAGVYDARSGLVKFRNATWFTNLEHRKRNEQITLYRRYADRPGNYPNYDNYAAINVDKVADIPEDYDGVMGVPITFMDKYCPEQFEIVGISYFWDEGFQSTKTYNDFDEVRPDGTRTGMTGVKGNGLAVLRGKPRKGNYLVAPTGEAAHILYTRIFVRNKKPSPPAGAGAQRST